MDFLKGQLDKIQQQLGGLNASQKMLTGSLVAIMVMTLLWWGRYAGTAEMEPVLPQSLSPADVASIHGHLKLIGIPTQVQGDKVLVPADRRDMAIASIAYAELLPEDSAAGFEEMIKQINPFMAQGMTEAYLQEAKQRKLEDVICKFEGVKAATVILTPPGEWRLSASNEATASISITMKDKGTGSRKVAQSAAMLVAGAEKRLPIKNTSVVIGSRPYRVTDPREGLGDSTEMNEALAGHERYFEEKVRDLYPDIQGLFVKVAVNLNTTSRQTQTKTHDNVQQKEKRSTNRTMNEPLGNGRGAPEPGAMPNTGASIDREAATIVGAGEKTEEETETDFEILADIKTETASRPAGDGTPVSAALRVPRSYFVNAFKANSGSTAEPQQEALLALVASELEQMRNQVVFTTAIQDQEKVRVTMYNDSPSPLRAAATATPPSAVGTMVGAYGKEIAIGALALISLFMVSMMVRKAGPAPAIALASAEPRETPRFDNMMEVAGIVGDTGQMLDGMELDEDAVRTQQMLDQVQTMVGENPDAAANLVKRWLNRT